MKSFTIFLIVALALTSVIAARAGRGGGGGGMGGGLEAGMAKVAEKFGVSPEETKNCFDFLKNLIFGGGDINPMKLMGLMRGDKLAQLMTQLSQRNACTEVFMKVMAKVTGGMDMKSFFGSS